MAVIVYTENWDGKFKKLSFELVSYASKLAEMMNTSLTAISIGNVDETELKKLAQYGANKILNVTGGFDVLDNQLFSNTIAEFAQKEDAKIIVLSNNNSGKALAPRLSVKLKAGMASGVGVLPISINPFIISKRSYSGNALAQVQINTEIKIVTLSQNSFELIEKAGNASIENVSVSVDQASVKTQLKDVQKLTGKILLTDADIVVSGGRGMKSPDNWGPLVELADLLGGATACSRPVSDEGWRGHEEHTGQTGKIIAPNLYIALGISGATQHLAGISSSKYIVAVNTDKDAPIFEAAQYGIVGDAQKILPKLVEAVKEVKGR